MNRRRLALTVFVVFVLEVVGLLVGGFAALMAVPLSPVLALRMPDDVAAFGQDDFNYNATQLDKVVPGPVFNVKGFGAKGDNSTDDTVAIQAAINAIPTVGTPVGGVLYFPAGNYIFSALVITKYVVICGDGWRTILRPNVVGADAITVTTAGYFEMRNLAWVPAANNTLGFYNVHTNGVGSVVLRNVQMVNQTGGLIYIQGANNAFVSDCYGSSSDAAAGGTCLKLRQSGGTITNSQFLSGAAPCLYVTGTATSLEFSNCGFSGGGPRKSFAVSAINSTASTFTVTTSTTHDLQAGDLLVVRNAAVAAYNSTWRIASVGATTIVVNSTLNPGTAAAQGTAEAVTSCALVSSEDGPVNESRFANCLFAGTGPHPYGAASLHFDGKRPPGYTLSGWDITGCYYDFGDIGVLISSSVGPPLRGFTINGGYFVQGTRSIHIEWANGVTIANVQCSPGTPADDGISASAAVYVYAGSSAPNARGISISNSMLGQTREWVTNVALKYGLLLDSAGINDLEVTGSILTGSVASVGFVNGALAAAARWHFDRNNQYAAGVPIANSAVQPSVASAATLDLTALPHTTIKVTGTTNIATISGGWFGRELTLIFPSALSLVTGGNLAIAVNYAVPAGQLVQLVFDGTSWYLK